MPYRLTPEESVPRGLRRVVREEIDSAIEHLRTKDQSKLDEGIHEARKSIKKLRGVVRLLMPGSGAAGKQDNATLRDVGRTLSDFRDAAAMVETVDELREKCPGDPGTKELAEVRLELVRRRNVAAKHQDGAAVAQEAILTLRRFRRSVSSWQISSDSFEAIAPGIERTYRRGRKALALAHRVPTPENYHGLRKRVKDHWYHIKILESLRGEVIESREKNLKDLQEWLGDDHNLTVLEQKITAEPAQFGEPEAIAAVTALIDRTLKELRKNSLEMATRLYEERPGSVTHLLARLWDEWRQQTRPERKTAKPVISVARRKRSAA